MMKIVLTGLIIEGIAGREGSCFGRGGYNIKIGEYLSRT